MTYFLKGGNLRPTVLAARNGASEEAALSSDLQNVSACGNIEKRTAHVIRRKCVLLLHRSWGVILEGM